MPSPRANLAAAIAIVGVLALVPRPGLKVVSYFHPPVTFLLSPVQQPVHSLFVWFRGAGSSGAASRLRWDDGTASTTGGTTVRLS